MAEGTQENSLHFLKPVDSLPFPRRDKQGFYADIINEFVESGLKYALVKDLGKKPIVVYVGLRSALKRGRVGNVKVLQIKNQVYLKKLG